MFIFYSTCDSLSKFLSVLDYVCFTSEFEDGIIIDIVHRTNVSEKGNFKSSNKFIKKLSIVFTS